MPTGGPVLLLPGDPGDRTPRASPTCRSSRSRRAPAGRRRRSSRGSSPPRPASATTARWPEQYLTPREQQGWNPSWSAIVYKDGPERQRHATATACRREEPEDGDTCGSPAGVQASLQGYGSYSVPSASAAGGSPDAPPSFDAGQGRRPVADLERAAGAAAHQRLVRQRLPAAQPVLLRPAEQVPGARPGLRAAAGDAQRPDERAGQRPDRAAGRLAVRRRDADRLPGRRPRSAASPWTA